MSGSIDLNMRKAAINALDLTARTDQRRILPSAAADGTSFVVKQIARAGHEVYIAMLWPRGPGCGCHDDDDLKAICLKVGLTGAVTVSGSIDLNMRKPALNALDLAARTDQLRTLPSAADVGTSFVVKQIARAGLEVYSAMLRPRMSGCWSHDGGNLLAICRKVCLAGAVTMGGSIGPTKRMATRRDQRCKRRIVVVRVIEDRGPESPWVLPRGGAPSGYARPRIFASHTGFFEPQHEQQNAATP